MRCCLYILFSEELGVAPYTTNELIRLRISSLSKQRDYEGAGIACLRRCLCKMEIFFSAEGIETAEGWCLHVYL